MSSLDHHQSVLSTAYDNCIDLFLQWQNLTKMGKKPFENIVNNATRISDLKKSDNELLIHINKDLRRSYIVKIIDEFNTIIALMDTLKEISSRLKVNYFLQKKIFEEIKKSSDIVIESDFHKYLKFLNCEEVYKGIESDIEMRKNICKFLEEFVLKFVEHQMLFNFKELEFLLELWIYCPYVKEDLLLQIMKSF